MDYFIIKWIHILSATVIFGTGLGSAFYFFIANRSKDVAVIAFAARTVVIADWLFTTPAVIVQFASGWLLAESMGFRLSELWLVWAIGLYLFAGACWLPVVRMQIVMRDLAQAALINQQALPPAYWRLYRWWLALGALAFPAVVLVFWLMVSKP